MAKLNVSLFNLTTVENKTNICLETEKKITFDFSFLASLSNVQEVNYTIAPFYLFETDNECIKSKAWVLNGNLPLNTNTLVVSLTNL
jgi:hypothetical protein